MVDIKQKFLSINQWSRPGKPMGKVRGLAIHWIGKPNQSAVSVWKYWESRKQGHHGYGSAHFIVDLDGGILQCIPQTELAYHVGAKTYTKLGLKHYGPYPNAHLLGIEMCHTDWDGRYTKETWESAVKLCAFLCRELGLTDSNIVTHNAVTGKECPRWMVHHPDELIRFLNEVEVLL